MISLKAINTEMGDKHIVEEENGELIISEKTPIHNLNSKMRQSQIYNDKRRN